MNRYQFEVLTYIEKNGKKEYPMRTLSDTLKISGRPDGDYRKRS